MLLRETKYVCIFLMMWLFCSKIDSSTIQSVKKNFFTRRLNDDRNTAQSINGILRMATEVRNKNKTLNCNSIVNNFPDSRTMSISDFHRRLKRCGGIVHSTSHLNRSNRTLLQRPLRRITPLVEFTMAKKHTKKYDNESSLHFRFRGQTNSTVGKSYGLNRKIDRTSNLIQRLLPKMTTTATVPGLITECFGCLTTISKPIVDRDKIEITTRGNFETSSVSKFRSILPTKYSTFATTVTEEITTTDYTTMAPAIDETTTADAIYTVPTNTVEYSTSGPIVGDTQAGQRERKRKKGSDFLAKLKKVIKGESPTNHIVKLENNRQEVLEGSSDTKNSIRGILRHEKSSHDLEPIPAISLASRFNEPAKTVITSGTLTESAYETNTSVDEKEMSTEAGQLQTPDTIASLETFEPKFNFQRALSSHTLPLTFQSSTRATDTKSYQLDDESSSAFVTSPQSWSSDIIESDNTDLTSSAVTDFESADLSAFNNTEMLERASANSKAKGTKNRLSLSYGTNDPPLNPNDNWKSGTYNDYSTLEDLKTILYLDASPERGKTKKRKSPNRIEVTPNSSGKFSTNEDTSAINSMLKSIEKNTTFDDTIVETTQSNETIVGIALEKGFSFDNEFDMANQTDTSSNMTSPMESQPADLVSIPFDKLIQNTTKNGDNILIISGVNDSILKAILELLRSNKSAARNEAVEPHYRRLPVAGRQARKNKPISKKGSNDGEGDEFWEDPRDEELKNRFYFVNPKILQNFISVYKKYSSGMR